MSTKIYDGFYIPETSLYDILEFLKSQKPILHERGREEYKKVFAIALMHMANYIKYGVPFDYANLNPQDYDGKNLRDLCLFIAMNFRDSINKNKDAKTYANFCIELGLDTSVYLFPMKSKTLGMVFSENGAMKEAFFSNSYIQQYPYWDNTDKPDDVSDEEWTIRKKDWDIVLPGLGIPKESGLRFEMFDCLNVAGIPVMETIKKYFTEEEAEKLAKETALDNAFKVHFEKIKTGDHMNDTKATRTYVRNNRQRILDKSKDYRFDIYQFLLDYKGEA